MTAPTAPPRASGPGARLAWRPLQRSTRVAIIGALIAAVFYQLFLLNPAYRGPTWLWIAMLAAEGLTALHLIGTWWTILAHDDRSEPVDVTVWRNRLRAGAEGPSIDVLITAYGEEPALVRRTMRAARDMDLPHRTYLLDDGDSDELRGIAAEEGVEYLRRDGGQHAKAGNVNAGTGPDRWRGRGHLRRRPRAGAEFPDQRAPALPGPGRRVRAVAAVLQQLRQPGLHRFR